MAETHDAPHRPISVFLLDDNVEVAAGLERWFARSKEFRWAGWLATPDDITPALAAVAPDVLLVDWDMPGTDTGALLTRLTKAFPNMHIAVLSGHLSPLYIRAALAAGAAGYIYKGQSPAQLAAEVQMVGEGRNVLSAEVQHSLGFDSGAGT